MYHTDRGPHAEINSVVDERSCLSLERKVAAPPDRDNEIPGLGKILAQLHRFCDPAGACNAEQMQQVIKNLYSKR